MIRDTDDADHEDDDNDGADDLIKRLRERDGYVCIPKSVCCLHKDQVGALRQVFAKLFDGRRYETGIYLDVIRWRKNYIPRNGNSVKFVMVGRQMSFLTFFFLSVTAKLYA